MGCTLLFLMHYNGIGLITQYHWFLSLPNLELTNIRGMIVIHYLHNSYNSCSEGFLRDPKFERSLLLFVVYCSHSSASLLKTILNIIRGPQGRAGRLLSLFILILSYLDPKQIMFMLRIYHHKIYLSCPDMILMTLQCKYLHAQHY